MGKYSLIGVDGNAFAVMGYVVKAMKEQNCSVEERSEYQKDAMSSDYNHLFCVSMDRVEELNKKCENENS